MQADKADTQQREQFCAASCRGHLVWVERVRALHWVFSVYRPTGSSGGAETEKPVRRSERDRGNWQNGKCETHPRPAAF